jgi:hypothetical protein
VSWHWQLCQVAWCVVTLCLVVFAVEVSLEAVEVEGGWRW